MKSPTTAEVLAVLRGMQFRAGSREMGLMLFVHGMEGEAHWRVFSETALPPTLIRHEVEAVARDLNKLLNALTRQLRESLGTVG